LGLNRLSRGTPGLLTVPKAGALELPLKLLYGQRSSLDLVDFGDRQLAFAVEAIKGVPAGLEGMKGPGRIPHPFADERLQMGYFAGREKAADGAQIFARLRRLVVREPELDDLAPRASRRCFLGDTCVASPG